MKNRKKIKGGGHWRGSVPVTLKESTLKRLNKKGDFYKKAYEKIKPYIKNFRKALDIGARFGESARYMVEDFDLVHCFEPRYEGKQVRIAVGEKGWRKVEFHQCALGSTEKIIEMIGSMVRTKNVRDYPKRWKIRNEVPQYTLDSFNFTDVDYIKIDVEGYELDVLKGAKNTLRNNDATLVMERNDGEIYGESDRFKEEDEILKSLGYSVVAECGVNDYILQKTELCCQ